MLKDCESGQVKEELSDWIHFMPKKLFTNIDKGITKIKLECVDLLQRHNDRRIEKVQGSDGNLKTLKKVYSNFSTMPLGAVRFKVEYNSCR